MDDQRLGTIAGGGAAGLCLLAWIFLPSLESSRRSVDADASVHLERARRTLHQYDSELAHRSLLLDQLRDADVDVDLQDTQSIVDNAADEYQENHASLWASFEPRDWQQDPPRTAKASYGNLGTQIRDGVKTRGVLTAQNAKLLKDALAEVDQALAVLSSDESGSSHFEANRLKGVIQYHRGVSERLRAGGQRDEGEAIRRKMVRLANEASFWAAGKTLVADSGIAGQLQTVKDRIAELERELAQDQETAEALDKSIRDFETRIADAKSRSEQARAELERLQGAGVDFSDANGAETFDTQVTAQDARYRAAVREMLSAQAGRLPQAEIDASGDFLRGRYIENGSSTDLTVEPGLSHYRDERQIVGARVAGLQEAVAAFGADLTRLEGIRAANQIEQDEAVRRISEAAGVAAESYTELSRVESEASAIEEGAGKILDQSISASQQAAAAVEKWISEARERTQNLAPETKERSAYAARENDDWLAGHIAAQSADARMQKAWMQYDRFTSATENAEVLSALNAVVRLPEADPVAERTKADEARTAGVEEITKAMEVLEKAHRRAEKHWTLTAQAAGTTYLMSLFGYPDYVADAVDGYRKALQGRETDKATEKLTARLKRLENR